MSNKSENTKLLTQSHKNTKIFFDNFILNQLNLENIQNNSNLKFATFQNIKTSKYLTPNKRYQNNIKNYDFFDNFQEKRINNYRSHDNINKILNKKERNGNKRFLTNINSFMDKKNKRNNSNIILKKYLLGNDVILPLKSIKDFENSNIPYYLFHNSNKTSKYSPIKIISKNEKNGYNSLSQKKSNKICDDYKLSNKRKRKSTDNFKKKIYLKNIVSEKLLSNSNKNKNNFDINLYDYIEYNSNSNKNIKIYFNTQQNNKNKIDAYTQVKNNDHSSNYESSKRINSALPSKKSNKKNNSNLKIHSYIKSSNNNNHLIENYKNEDFDNKKDLMIGKAKKLIDEPNSFVCLIYNKLKNTNFDEERNKKKLNLKKKFIEYKKDLNKLEQRVRYELFNLKKQTAIGKENNIKGKIISTNTFFNLAFGEF